MLMNTINWKNKFTGQQLPLGGLVWKSSGKNLNYTSRDWTEKNKSKTIGLGLELVSSILPSRTWQLKLNAMQMFKFWFYSWVQSWREHRISERSMTLHWHGLEARNKDLFCLYRQDHPCLENPLPFLELSIRWPWVVREAICEFHELARDLQWHSHLFAQCGKNPAWQAYQAEPALLHCRFQIPGQRILIFLGWSPNLCSSRSLGLSKLRPSWSAAGLLKL